MKTLQNWATINQKTLRAITLTCSMLLRSSQEANSCSDCSNLLCQLNKYDDDDNNNNNNI
jgi:hypothetical protein